MRPTHDDGPRRGHRGRDATKQTDHIQRSEAIRQGKPDGPLYMVDPHGDVWDADAWLDAVEVNLGFFLRAVAEYMGEYRLAVRGDGYVSVARLAAGLYLPKRATKHYLRMLIQNGWLVPSERPVPGDPRKKPLNGHYSWVIPAKYSGSGEVGS